MMGHCTGAGNEAQDCRCDGGIPKTAVYIGTWKSQNWFWEGDQTIKLI